MMTSTDQLLAIVLNFLNKHPSLRSIPEQIEAAYKRLTEAVSTRDEFGMDPVLINLVRPIFQFLYNEWWHVEVAGIKNIPLRGEAIIAANHSGMLPYDAVMLNMAVYSNHPKKRNVRFLVADFVDNFPFISQFISRSGGVKASPENAAKLLKKKELICVFPEGTRGIGKLYEDRYKLQSFGRGGVVRLAIQTGAPIIPCAIIGAEEIHPIIWKSEEMGKRFGLPFLPVTPTFPLFGILGLVPLPSRWKIVFGRPIRCKKTQKDIEGLTSDLRAEIQNMIDEELGE